jgi:CRP/FNR family transcriptional regulator, cyclic AMP receptor protein
MADLADALRRVSLFSALSDKDRKRLAKAMSERTFNEGAMITTEGEGGVGFFVIDHGNATVSVDGKIVRTLGPGDYLGEIALIDKGPRSATIVATTDLRCYGMSAWEFRPFIHEHPDVAWTLLETLVGRLREAQAAGEH